MWYANSNRHYYQIITFACFDEYSCALLSKGGSVLEKHFSPSLFLLYSPLRVLPGTKAHEEGAANFQSRAGGFQHELCAV
jgi:hypothetical protein